MKLSPVANLMHHPLEKEENRKKMPKFAYSKVLSYTSGVTEISNFYKYLPNV